MLTWNCPYGNEEAYTLFPLLLSLIGSNFNRETKAYRETPGLPVTRIITLCLLDATVYKAGLSTVGHLNNLVTKNITKYPVLATYKISKKYKFYIPNFFEKEFWTQAPQTFFQKFGKTKFLFLGIL